MIKLAGILALVTTASAATVQSPLILSNFQTSAVVSITGTGAFGGWEITERAPGTSPWDTEYWGGTLPAGTVQAFLSVGGSSHLIVGAEAQSINATASVDWIAPGYRLAGVDLFGRLGDDGSVAGEAMWITSPCGASVSGSIWGYDSGACAAPDGTHSGTLTADLRIRSDANVFWAGAARGYTEPLQITLTLVQNPEPGTLLLIGCGLVGLALIKRRRV